MITAVPSFWFPTSKKFNPARVQNLVCWQSSARSIQSDISNRVSVIDDLSQNSRPFNQIAALDQPLLVANEQNGKPTVKFNGINEFMVTPSFSVSQPFTVYMMMKQVTWTTGDRFWSGIGASQPIIYQNLSTPRIYLFAGGSNNTFISPTLNTYFILTAVFNNTSSLLRINNGTAATGTPGTQSIGGGICLGANNNTPPTIFGDVFVGEHFVYSGAHDSETQNSLINYLNREWSVF